MELDKNLISYMEKIPGIENVEKNAPMSRYTSFKAGGEAEALVTVSDESALVKLLGKLKSENVPHMMMGAGSNILVRDGGYRGVIIRLGMGFSHIRYEDDLIRCGAAAKLSAVSKFAMDRGLQGLEFMCGIPGSIGGGLCMNAGAYGGEIKDFIDSAEIISAQDGQVRNTLPAYMGLGYRSSAFQKSGDIILSASFKLKEGEKAEIQGKMQSFMESRNSKQPVQYPSAGSFFKRPKGNFAGTLIEKAGLKGLSIGGAQVSPLHGGFIINMGGASATDILQLMEVVQHRVADKFEIWLEPEVRIIGEE